MILGALAVMLVLHAEPVFRRLLKIGVIAELQEANLVRVVLVITHQGGRAERAATCSNARSISKGGASLTLSGRISGRWRSTRLAAAF